MSVGKNEPRRDGPAKLPGRAHYPDDAAKRVKIEYEPLPPVFDMEQSDKVFKSFLISRGDLDAGFAAADFIVEGEYGTPSQEQAYIENNAIAAYERDGVLVITGSLQ